MRRASRVDDNQGAIVEKLRSLGVWVQHLHAVGKGCPDLLCWSRGRFFLLEVKEEGERPTKKQAAYMATCPGEIHIARTEQEALEAAFGKAVLA